MNGQKVWTTLAHVAHFGILLARTDPGRVRAGRHHLLRRRHALARESRCGPLVQMTGTHEFNEVFFTDVRIPAANVVGTEHDGWRLAKVTLGNERVSLSGEGALWGRGPTAGDVIELVRAHGGTTDLRLRQQLARLYSEAEVLRLIRLRTLSARLRGLEPGPEASVRKAMSDEHGQHVMALAKITRPARTACSPTAARTARPTAACGTTATSTRVRSRSAAARARCSATSSARRSWASRATRAIRAVVRPVVTLPLQNPTASVLTVPFAHVRSGSSCENTPFGLSQPGTTHACTIHTVFFMKVPCTPSHCALVMSRSGANGTAIEPPGPRPYWMQRLWCRCQWSFGPGKPDGRLVAERDVHQADELRGRIVAVVDEAAGIARIDAAVGTDLPTDVGVGDVVRTELGREPCRPGACAPQSPTRPSGTAARPHGRRRDRRRARRAWPGRGVGRACSPRARRR